MIAFLIVTLCFTTLSSTISALPTYHHPFLEMLEIPLPDDVRACIIAHPGEVVECTQEEKKKIKLHEEDIKKHQAYLENFKRHSRRICVARNGSKNVCC